MWFLTGNSYAQFFNNPDNWRFVLKDYPNLHLNLGHFGGFNQWKRLQMGKNNTWASRIMSMLSEYDGLYADISFTNAYPEILNLIYKTASHSKLVRERMLYGLDYYMVVTRGHYRSLKADFDVFMGDVIMNQIMMRNARAFLYL